MINLTQNFIKELYLGTSTSETFKKPIVQLLDFQVSQCDSKEIIIRISDGKTFIDCPLVGPYKFKNNKIITHQHSTSIQSFKKLDLVQIVDYYSKIDNNKICKLKIIVRKIIQQSEYKDKIGNPEEIAQFIHNNKLQQINNRVNDYKQFRIPTMPMNQNDNGSRPSNAIKIQDENENSMNKIFIKNERDYHQGNVNGHQSHPITSHKQRDEDLPLTLRDIENGFDGFFIGRLLRMKSTIKDTREGPMTMLYLGFVDSVGDLVRVNLAGRIAMKQQKNLRLHRCYYIKGLELKHGTQVGLTPHIRIQDKQYRIQQVTNQEITSKFETEYFYWSHQHEEIQFQYVDVIGIVEDIEQKTSYSNANDMQRDVVRIVIRNKMKTVKISFWADQIKTLQTLRIQKYQPLIFEDIKKKKIRFLDFTFQSNLIKLQQNQNLLNKFKQFLPSTDRNRPQPSNIRELNELYQDQPSNPKLYTVQAYLIKFHDNRLVHKWCQECRKKVDKQTMNCTESHNNKVTYRYNCLVFFADCTGSLACILVDTLGQQFFGQSARQVAMISDNQLEKYLEKFAYNQYLISVESKSNKLILIAVSNLGQINQQVRHKLKRIREKIPLKAQS